MKPGTISTIPGGGGTVFQGESATRLFQIRVVINALEFEHRTGLKMTRAGALPIAKKLTGLTTNNRPRLIAALEEKAVELGKNVTVVP